jgi:hypothetical protein
MIERARGLAGQASVVAALAAVAVVTPLGGALGSLVGAPAECAGAAGSIHVAVVVDYGGIAGAPVAARSDCISVPAGSNGATVLAARATQLGLPAPRWDVNNGLLCAIDGFPRTGCAASDANGTYTYWSYWGAVGDSWQYATTGPIGHVLRDGAVEGWRFGSGRGTSQDDAPRASVAASRCPTAPTSTPPSPTVVPPAGVASIASSPASGASASRSVAAPSGAASSGAAAASNVAPTTTVAGGPAPQAAIVPDATVATSTTSIAPAAVKGASEQRAGSIRIGTDDGGGTGWVPTVGGVAAVSVAAGAVLFVRRRRMRGEP